MTQVEDGEHQWDQSRQHALAWVVSPHLLVAQAVTAALRAAGAPVAFHAWETLHQDLHGPAGVTAPRHVVAVVDGLVDDEVGVVEGVAGLTGAADVRVVVVTTDTAPPRWGRLLRDERIELVTMTTAIGDLAAAVTRFADGEALMTPGDRARLRAECERALRKERAAEALIDTLSPQQLRVLRLLATGNRVREVARLLDVSDGTVRSHVKALRQRIGARTQLEAVAILRQVEDVGGHGGVDGRVPRPRTPVADAGCEVPRR